MAITESSEFVESIETPVQLSSFSIEGLFGYLNHKITFPPPRTEDAQPEIVIIEGQNGTGKTSILNMIAGIVQGLDFDPFRKVPFAKAELHLSNGDAVKITYDPTNSTKPLFVEFRDLSATLLLDKTKYEYSPAEDREIADFRKAALPILKNIYFDLLTVDRLVELTQDRESAAMVYEPELRKRREAKLLARRVQNFLRDVQINYRKYFQASQLELLPRIMQRFAHLETELNPQALISKITEIRSRNSEIKRFGLETDNAELDTLEALLNQGAPEIDQHSMSLLATYVEINDNRKNARDLIIFRLTQFEELMNEFFVGKFVRISAQNGLEIIGQNGRLKESDLSSGEYHFLYMMVAALLCERSGTVLAIDEPELSLHVSWQRKLLGALTKCAAGASPLFLLATHSTAISAAHAYAVQTLSPIE